MPLELEQTRVAIAAVTACAVKALSERDPDFQAIFEQRLERAYVYLRDAERSNTGAMETIGWIRDFLKAV